MDDGEIVELKNSFLPARDPKGIPHSKPSGSICSGKNYWLKFQRNLRSCSLETSVMAPCFISVLECKQEGIPVPHTLRQLKKCAHHSIRNYLEVKDMKYIWIHSLGICWLNRDSTTFLSQPWQPLFRKLETRYKTILGRVSLW